MGLSDGIFARWLRRGVKRNIGCSFDCAGCKLVRRAHVNKSYCSLVEVFEFTPIYRRHPAGKYVLGYVSCHCHGIFGRRIGWGVGMFSVYKFRYTPIALYYLSKHVDSFVYTVIADNLRSKQFAVVGENTTLIEIGVAPG